MERRPAPVGARLWFAAVALCCYAAAVSGPWQRVTLRADLRGCVEFHAMQDQVLLVAGLLLGLAAGSWQVGWMDRVLRALFPRDPVDRRRIRLRWAAAIVLVLGALTNVLWVGSPVDVFIDLHRALLVEADVLLCAMGALQGGGWYALLDRDAPWLALPVMPAMGLMLVVSGVVGHGWC